MDTDYNHPCGQIGPGLRHQPLRHRQPSRGNLAHQIPQPAQAQQPETASTACRRRCGRSTFKPVTYLGAVESLVLLGGTLVVAPPLTLAATALADRLAGERGLGLRRTFVVFGYMCIPVGLAMHLAHDLTHLLPEGSGIVPVDQRAVALYMPLSFGEPDWQVSPLAAEPVVGLLQMTIVVGFFALSLVAGRRLSLRAHPDPRAASRAFIPMAALSFVFTVAGIVLLQQPMGMRHGM